MAPCGGEVAGRMSGEGEMVSCAQQLPRRVDRERQHQV